MNAGGKLTDSEALEAEKAVGRIPVRSVCADVHGSLQLALEHGIHAYDAYFLHCAQAFSCPFITLDRRMKQVGAHRGIKVLE